MCQLIGWVYVFERGREVVVEVCP
ncbi:hypothetical protein NITLEN_10317 [Nitrospira lenta]|uniref:Uncharacterized protein n=1 Tax=Nitrospira lenta TaxID=1436998 RepID=A0A330L0B4_9BACT|nr:hypothetical protein NITLEN_10317 [Nitrospira lenta]